MDDRRVAVWPKSERLDDAGPAGVIAGSAGADHHRDVRHVAKLCYASEHRHSIDRSLMTCGVVVQVPSKPPVRASGIQRPDRLYGLSPETAGPYHDELALRRGRHGTGARSTELDSADFTTDAT